MPKTYSEDFRFQVLSCIDRGKSRAEICDFFEISLRTLDRWLAASRRGTLQAYNQRGEYAPRKISSDALRQAMADHPDKTLAELANIFGCCFQAVDQRLRKLGITRKKNHAVRGAKRGKKTGISD